MVDQFTTWIDLKANVTKSDSRACRYSTSFICPTDCAHQIFIDQGSNFDGSLFQSLCDLLEMAILNAEQNRSALVRMDR